jgi:aminopeptidase N
VTEALGEMGDPAVVARARQLLRDDTGTATRARGALDIAAAQADPATFDRLVAMARATPDPLDKLHVYAALGGVEDPALADRMMAVALSGEMPSGSNVGVLLALARNHPDLAWNRVIPHLDDPQAGIDRALQWRLAGSIAGLSADPDRLAALQSYVDQNVPAEARRPFAGVMAAIRQNGRITATVLPELDRWIAAQTKN